MRIKTLALAGCVFLATASAALAGTTCLRNGDIDSYNPKNDRTLIVTTTRHNKWKISLGGGCNNLAFKDVIGFKTLGGPDRLACVEAGDQVILRQTGSGFPSRCNIMKVEPYVEAPPATAAH